MSGKLRHTLVVRDPEGAATALLAGESVPDWATDLVHADDHEAGDSSDEDSDDDQDAGSLPSYKSMKKPELEAEVAKRNEGRDPDDVIEVEGKGNVPDLIAALEADDAAQADQA